MPNPLSIIIPALELLGKNVNILPTTGEVTGAGAAATAVGAVDGISLNALGSGYTAAPTVYIDPPPAGV